MATKRITATLVERIRPPTEGRLEIYDDLLSGFCLRVTQRGRKSWSVVYRIHHQQTRLTLGRYPLLPLAEAREEARKALLLVDRGIDPAVQKRETEKAKKHSTFKAVADLFIERYARPKNRTWQASQRLMDNHCMPIWGNKPIVDIKRQDVIDLLDEIADNGAPHTARQLFAVIRKFFNWAASRNIIDTSPCLHVESPCKVVSRDRVLSDDEVKAIWGACSKENYPFGTLVKFLLATGQRREEVASMTWSEINLEEKLWCIPRERVKSDRAQEVPLSSLAMKLLESVPRFEGKDAEYVFTTTGGKKPFAGFSKAKKRVDIMSEVTAWRIHDLRRTCGTGMAKIGVPVPIISHVLNHAQSGVTAIYNRHSYLPEKRDALEKWGKKIEEIVSAK